MGGRWAKILFNFAIAATGFLTLILLPGDARIREVMPFAEAFVVQATRVKLPPGNVEIPTALSLRLTDAWHLISTSEQFGGLSAAYGNGSAMTFVTDKGALIRLGLDRTSNRWNAVATGLPHGCGDMTSKLNRDTESIAVDRKSGAFWIGFEFRNVICRVAAPDAGGTRYFAPPEMHDWPLTRGPETMVRLQSGGFLIFQERPKDYAPESELLYFDRDPTDPKAKLTKMRYRPPTNYRPVDAAQLPDGRLLVLNRRFAFPFNFSGRLSIIDLPPIKEGALLSGPIVARLEGDELSENFEALAIDNDGEDLTIWVAADDNFFAIQRTMLLRFVWPLGAKLEPARRARS